MPHTSTGVKRLQAALDLGFTLTEAVSRALGMTITAWAEAHGYRQPEVSMCLGGYPDRAYASIREDLATDLAITREELDELIDGSDETAGVA